jgi:hypothetical protein
MPSLNETAHQPSYLGNRGVRGVTSKDLLGLVRAEGRTRGARVLRSARAGRAVRGKGRAG